MAELTPMMRQYMDLKEKHKDCLLFFRLGDFYEMFFEDAITASNELSLFLTGRDCGLEKRAPMCGVPFHSVDTYINRLVKKGYKVAICEQLTDPAIAKGIVERGVVRVITPGTVVEEEMLEQESNNYIFCASLKNNCFGYAYCDVSTGEFCVFEGENGFEGVLEALLNISPKEILIDEEMNKYAQNIMESLRNMSPLIQVYEPWAFEVEFAQNLIHKHFNVNSLDGFGLKTKDLAVSAAGALINYLYDTQKNSLAHINKIKLIKDSEYMVIDSSTRRNLELIKTLREGSSKGSLMWLLDKTKTAMGARLLKQWIIQPLNEINEIEARQEAVGDLTENSALREGIREKLSGLIDLERIIARLAYNSFDAKNCISLKNSIAKLPEIKKLLVGLDAPLISRLNAQIDELADIYNLIETSIEDEPSGITDGNIIKTGYNPAIDELKKITEQGKDWLNKLEEQERLDTGIKNLKIGFNKVFGYYIDVTKSYLDKVPYRYVRKQTLSNNERFITEELKSIEDKLLNADEKLKRLEYAAFIKIRERIADATRRMQRVAHALAAIDVLNSLAQVAFNNGYIKPQMCLDGEIIIKDGKHPVVELAFAREFVPNDTNLNTQSDIIMIITGPNMAGKSTYMRQVGLLTLMAHMGSYIPASYAKISITDRIFTRVGASDDLAAGQSTFMVEMNEVANILNNATSKSLLILDEIGRGTSTFDGLAIAWSVVEYLSDRNLIGAKTLFATHYHELTEIEGSINGVKNYQITVRKYGDEIIFLHKIVRGNANRSFGIEVAKLAGLPEAVINRAKLLLKKLLSADIAKEKPKGNQITFNEVLVQNDEIHTILKETNVDNLTPLQALSLLCELKAKA